MFSRSFWLKFIVFLVLTAGGLSWRRRRRRRAPPPPPTDCVVSAWSPWSECSKKCDIGSHTRHRSILTDPAYGGRDCPTLTETGQCGAQNGGCQYTCQPADGSCQCQTGYKLSGDQKTCEDTDECATGTSSCVNANCINNEGSYSCQCLPGYQTSSANRKNCVPSSCDPLTFQPCPADAYRDAFGAACLQVQANCPSGVEFLKTCTLICPANYELAIVPQASPGKRFGEDFATVDFKSPHDLFTCSWDANAGRVLWDYNSEKDSYYCRRLNDPPVDIALSNSTLKEKEKIFAVIGSLSANDPQRDKLVFSIQNADGNARFLIQGHHLQVKTVPKWNPIGTMASNTYAVVVNATDNGFPPMYSQTLINITVLNINDPPHDLELSKSDVSENVPNGTILGNLSAIDDDIGPQRSSNFSWELVDSDNGFFYLNGSQMFVAKLLDHEKRSVHRIRVRCSDFGKPKQTSETTTFLINVRNENDSPKSVTLTKTSVRENSAVGTVIGKVMATDQDNDTLFFTLNGTDQPVLDKFRLELPPSCSFQSSTPGEKAAQTCSVDLVVKGSLDYEQEDEYVVWVAVADPGGTTQKNFKIAIVNVNEGPTAIIITNNDVPENSRGGTVVGEFIVTDPDYKNVPPQTHTCSLDNTLAGDEDAFIITHPQNRNILEVKTNKLLDYEKKEKYKINVTCKDNGQLHLTKSFDVVITDVNEKPTGLYLSSKRVKENSPDFTIIGTLSADDPEGDNQTFIYTVTHLTSGNFFIGGPAHNQLLVNASLDFEKTETVVVIIQVADSGGLHFERNFTINVEDVNDPPTDISLPRNVTLPENSVYRRYIGAVSIKDQDSNTNPSCRLLNSSEDRVQLNDLNLLVGPTMTDYESLDSSKSLKILLNCSDGHGASITKWLTVNVKDVNEPITGLRLSSLQVRENKNESLVGILRITDADVGQRHNCSILKNSGQRHSVFYIDGSTNPPTLRTAQPLNFESSREHFVDIMCEDIVKDHDQPTHLIEKQFVIAVIDVNERPVVLCNSSFYISTTSSSGSVVGQVEGYDPDNEKYHKSKISNPNGPFDSLKQELNYRFEPENNSWAFDITLNGVIYLEGRLNQEESEITMMVGVHVEDDGAVWKRANGSHEYQIKKDERKHSVHQCRIVITSNVTDKDILLSSNHVYENATNGTVIGKLSRQMNTTVETITYHVIDNETTPFDINGDTLYLSSRNSLDYEVLPDPKTLPVIVSRRGSVSGVFTKRFIIEIIDVNERPTRICLLPREPIEDCSAVGQVFIEDLDYPELQCESIQATHAEAILTRLLEYSCLVDEGKDTLSNTFAASEKFFISQPTLTLHAKKTVFAQGDRTYKVPVVCRSTLHPLHIIDATLYVNITVPTHPTCRDSELCASCPQPKFCLSHVRASASSRCVDKEYRINSTVTIPETYFSRKGFIFKFEEYIKSLIERKSENKTLEQLMKEFDDQNKVPSRRRREVNQNFDNVYVELFIYEAMEGKTTVVFAAAEVTSQSFKLIPAALVCQLLQDSEVKCSSDNATPNPNTGDDSAGFPYWIVVVVVGVLVLVVVAAAVILWRRRRYQKRDEDAVVHFTTANNQATIDTLMDNNSHETPVEPTPFMSTFTGQKVGKHPARPLLDDGITDPVLLEKRRDIEVFDNPTYRSPVKPEGHSDSDDDNLDEFGRKKRTLNHYEKANLPDHVYETVDDEFYEKVAEETKPKKKKSRKNPVYDMEEDADDTMNPVITLSTSPSKKSKSSEKYYDGSDREDSEEEEISTFKTNGQQKIIQNSRKGLGIVNPTYQVEVDEAEEYPQESRHPKYLTEVSNELFQPTDESQDASPPERNEDQSSC